MNTDRNQRRLLEKQNAKLPPHLQHQRRHHRAGLPSHASKISHRHLYRSQFSPSNTRPLANLQGEDSIAHRSKVGIQAFKPCRCHRRTPTSLPPQWAGREIGDRAFIGKSLSLLLGTIVCTRRKPDQNTHRAVCSNRECCYSRQGECRSNNHTFL